MDDRIFSEVYVDSFCSETRDRMVAEASTTKGDFPIFVGAQSQFSEIDESKEQVDPGSIGVSLCDDDDARSW